MSPRSPEQFESIRQERKQEIIEAATKLFAHKGFASTSISDIAKEVGMSKGLFYNYFESKEELRQELLPHVMAKMGGGFEKLYHYESGNPEKAAEIFIEALNGIKASLKKDAEFWMLYYHAALHADFMSESMQKQIKNEEASIQKKLSQLLEDLGFSNSRLEAIRLEATLDGISMNLLIPGKMEIYPIDEMFDFLISQYTQKTA